jgi:hypothetical protein
LLLPAEDNQQADERINHRHLPPPSNLGAPVSEQHGGRDEAIIRSGCTISSATTTTAALSHDAMSAGHRPGAPRWSLLPEKSAEGNRLARHRTSRASAPAGRRG